jgi:hypothetical protein
VSPWSFPEKVDAGERTERWDFGFENDFEESIGGKITKGAMEALSVVEGLEVVEKRSGGGAFGVEGEGGHRGGGLGIFQQRYVKRHGFSPLTQISEVMGQKSGRILFLAIANGSVVPLAP